MNQSRPEGMGACLDQSVLKAYDLGTIPEAQLERVASHLAACPNCESVLEALHGGEDAFMHNLRYYLHADPPVPLDEGQETGADPAAKLDRSAHALAGLNGLPRRFGEYELLELLPAGGMSYVYKARQFQPNRLVAIKIPQCAPLPGLEGFERFQREIETIAQLQHDHVVQIYQCGEEEGLRYFSMEYMDGGSLAAKLHPRVVGPAVQPDDSGGQAGKLGRRAGSPLPEREAAQLMQTLARVVQFAHEHGIIHRDLKPANVLLGADGSVKLTDFGLAKWLDGEEELTRSHAILGTAKYMAPEQARGDTEQIGVRTDVYGLGTILYECLTGRAPFQGATRSAVLRLVESSTPAPPSHLRRGLCRTLEAICLKCLEKDPQQRYASAEELADDLWHWLNHEPTKARPPRLPARVYRKARRHVLALSLMATLLVALTSVIVLDPERPVRKIEGKLANRQPVTLIPEKGKPAWFQILLGKESTQVSFAEDGSFAVHSGALCLMDLVRDPQQDRYHFRAQVRHLKSDGHGEVGIYLAHRAYPSAQADIHVFTQLSFSSMRDDTPPNFPTPKTAVGPLPRGNVVTLLTHIYSVRDQRELASARIGGVSGSRFQPLGLNDPWHKLDVRVSPESLRATWDGQLVGELSVSEAIDRFANALSRRRQRHPDDPLVSIVPADLPLRGSLGLYAYQGSVYFRCVQVDPERDDP